MKRMQYLTTAALLSTVLLAGCGNLNKTQQNTLGGAALGAAAGGIIGQSWGGAAAGAAVGAVGGSLMSN